LHVLDASDGSFISKMAVIPGIYYLIQRTINNTFLKQLKIYIILYFLD